MIKETIIDNSENRYFLQGGGEMGKLIRSMDWEATPLGNPDFWPSSLKTSVAMILDNPFGMYLAWGKEYIQMYNDGYRPILGENKHPKALGISTRETFNEIWHIIGPMFDGVMEGKAVGFPDFILPLNRNGFVEECYFDFSYSPIRLDDGTVGGVLVTVIETTNKKKAEVALIESEQRFRTMAEGIDVLISTSDETSNATYFNKAWIDFTGRSMEKLVNYGWVDLIQEEDRQGFLDIYLNAFKRREDWEGEFRILDKHDQCRHLLAKGQARFHSNGGFAGYISSSLDITDRKEAENLLRKSEVELRSFIESAPYPIGVYTGEELIVQVANQAMLDIWGKGKSVFGKPYKEILPELRKQEIFEQLDSVYRSGIAIHEKNKRLDLLVNGQIQTNYFNYSFTPLFDEEGRVYGVMNTGADVTDLNLAKQRVEQSENSLKETILQAPVAMCILKEPNFVVELANDLMCELWGKTQEEVSGKPIFVGLSEAKDQGFEELLTGVYNNGEPHVAEGAMINLPRGNSIEKVYVNFVYAPYREKHGVISGVLVIAVDVTPQVLAHQQIEEVVAVRTKELAMANNDLQRSNAELAQFAYIASHDLQEPIRKISTYTQLLEKRMQSTIDEHSRGYFEKINNSSLRMSVLIKDVLTYSEISKNADLVTLVDLNEIIENVLKDFELLMEEKDARVQYDLLPVIEAIPLQMSQLFSNLISNALKFSRKGIAPIIQISVFKASAEEIGFLKPNSHTPYVKIKVADNGVGFKQEQQDKIFHIFQRLHRKSEYDGTGIGLAMCKKIALNHHGDLNAEGSSEAGAVFNIILPVQQQLLS